MLDQPFGLFDHHLGNLDMTGGGLVKGRGNHLTLYRAFHVGDLFRTLVDEENDQGHLGVVRCNRVGNGLQHHRLTGARGRHQQTALSLAQGGHEIHHPRRHVVWYLEPQPFLGIERREVVEVDLLHGHVGRLEVDRFDLDQSKVPLALLGRPDLA